MEAGRERLQDDGVRTLTSVEQVGLTAPLRFSWQRDYKSRRAIRARGFWGSVDSAEQELCSSCRIV